MGVVSANSNHQVSDAITGRLGKLARLSPHELAILQDLPQSGRHYPARAELCLAGEVQSPLMLLSGWACYQRILGDGRRQIIRFILPGDAIGSIAYPSMPVIATALALTPVVVADARPLLNATHEMGVPSAGLAEALVAIKLAEEEGMYDQIVRLGQQTAYQRIVHMILELHDRLQASGLINGNSFSIPFTQETLADALGLSVVHVNRTLQQVRRDKLLEMRGSRVVLHQLDQMRRVADWSGNWKDNRAAG